MDSLPDSMFSVNADTDPLDDSGAETTPAQVLAEMRTAWQNEIAAPALLPHRFDALECLVDQIEGMEENLAMCRDKAQLKVSIHRMELHRITYLINDYMRVRLGKIEENARAALREHERRINEQSQAQASDELIGLLAPQEIEFAKKYAEMEGRLFGNKFLGRLPAALRKIPTVEPDLECERVYAQVVADDVEDVSVPDYQDRTSEVIVKLMKDTIHLISYESIQEHVEAGRVRLL